MELIQIGISISIFAFFINFVWEVWHSELYTTCHRMTYWSRMRLLTLMSLKDALWITFLYLVTYWVFGTSEILSNPVQLVTFTGLALLVGYLTEYTALKWERWEYAKRMPLVLGVGLTPLLELAVTGILAFVLSTLW